MRRTSWLIGSVAVGLSMLVEAGGQTPRPPSPRPTSPKLPPQPAAEQAVESAKPADPFAALRDKPKGNDEAVGNLAPAKPGLNFPPGGFKGNDDRVPLQELIEEQQQQAAQNERQRRAGNNNFRGFPQNRFGVRQPVYVPGYNPNRPYGYPNHGYPIWYGYPGYGYVYPGYGYGYGYWYSPGNGVWRPGVTGGSPAGGSTFFGDPHASQYFGNPHASQGR